MGEIKLKSIIRVFHIEGTTILNVADKSYRLDDNNQLIYQVLMHLKSNISLDDLYSKVVANFSNFSKQELKDVITQLDDLFFLEGTSKIYTKMEIGDYHKERYSRNIDFFGNFCKINDNKYTIQEKILDTKIALFGVGGVGSHILLDLVSMGFINVTAIDFDKVELSNLNRQILYNEESIGKYKVDEAEKVINRYSKYNKVTFVKEYVETPQSVEKIVKGHDLAIICVDRPNDIVSTINEGCVKANVPLIGGGVDTTRTMLYTIIPYETGCIDCWKNYVKNNSEMEDKIVQEELKVNYSNLPMRPAVVNLVAIQAGMILSEVLKFAMKLPLSSTNKVIQFDFESLQTSIIETWNKDPHCKICSRKEKIANVNK